MYKHYSCSKTSALEAVGATWSSVLLHMRSVSAALCFPLPSVLLSIPQSDAGGSGARQQQSIAYMCQQAVCCYQERWLNRYS
jgi:hypothetical protein